MAWVGVKEKSFVDRLSQLIAKTLGTALSQDVVAYALFHGKPNLNPKPQALNPESPLGFLEPRRSAHDPGSVTREWHFGCKV